MTFFTLHLLTVAKKSS